MRPVHSWIKQTLDDPQVLLVLVLLTLGLAFVTLVPAVSAPVISAVVVAFILDGPNRGLRRLGLPHPWSAVVTYVLFIAFTAALIGLAVPALTRQVVTFAEQLPGMVGEVNRVLTTLPEAYPKLVGEDQLAAITGEINAATTNLVRGLVTFSLTSAIDLISTAVYMILTLVMVFFLLKDRRQILDWIAGFMPEHRPMADRIWREFVARAGDYARGKVYEIVIVAAAAWVTFLAIGLDFAALLAVMTGLSVIIPFIGAAVVTVPVALVAFFQWGLSFDFALAVGAYLLLQGVDGNVLVPLLFSEVVKLHPLAVIVAILFFGGIWGVGGLFFAVPLATLAKAVMDAWPAGTSTAEAEAGQSLDPAA
ncbi:hypothetical protein CCR85_05075 [Rhodothalassium salexigens]|uniref:AI-2E family transporter n=1 Tax=Rhodothalassium salexigens TaxID=1086 RepID=UPI0019124219|nr:AI-2E family transporter [Rhodothalassium salexigens]MBK5910864.1 hypothetical protein [Rhodothalassium salexigens]